MEEKQYKLIFNAGVSRRLIRDYHIPVSDIKADKTNHDKTVFVFERTPEFEAAFAQINAEIEKAKSSSEQ